ncbi:hypothetical protein HK098_005736 [Nowakowskiella sp. JEL0407]|nr:hypothetical protein HK098_005736 [Nowakowskiella sp. JEL0407]
MKLYSEVRNRSEQVEIVLDRVIDLCKLPGESFVRDISLDDCMRKRVFLVPELPIHTTEGPTEKAIELLEENYHKQPEAQYGKDEDCVIPRAPSLISKLKLGQTSESSSGSITLLSATSPADDEVRDVIARIEKLKEEMLERKRSMAELKLMRKQIVQESMARSQKFQKWRIEMRLDKMINDFNERRRRLSTQDEEFNVDLETRMSIPGPQTFDETLPQAPMEIPSPMKEIEYHLKSDFEITSAIEKKVAEANAVLTEPILEESAADDISEETLSAIGSSSSIRVPLPSRLNSLKVDESEIISSEFQIPDEKFSPHAIIAPILEANRGKRKMIFTTITAKHPSLHLHVMNESSKQQKFMISPIGKCWRSATNITKPDPLSVSVFAFEQSSFILDPNEKIVIQREVGLINYGTYTQRFQLMLGKLSQIIDFEIDVIKRQRPQTSRQKFRGEERSSRVSQIPPRFSETNQNRQS